MYHIITGLEGADWSFEVFPGICTYLESLERDVCLRCSCTPYMGPDRLSKMYQYIGIRP